MNGFICDDPGNDEGALTTAAITTITSADNINSLMGDDAYHVPYEPSPTSFSLSLLTDNVSRQLVALSDTTTPPSQQHRHRHHCQQHHRDDGETVHQQWQLEAWMLSHDLVWPDGDYFKATKISMHQGVAQLKRGRRYVFVEPVLGPASSYLYPNFLSPTQQQHQHQQHHDSGVQMAAEELVEAETATSEDIGQDQGHTNQIDDATSKEAEVPRSAGSPPASASADMSQISSASASPSPSLSTSPSPSSSTLIPSTCVLASDGDDNNDQSEEPYSPLLDPSMDGQDQFEYGLYELSYVPQVAFLSPKDFVPTTTSFLVRLDEDRPTLASPVPASSKQSECRCQLMMRKMVMQRELLQVRECTPPIMTLAEQRAQREREAMLGLLQLRLSRRARRAGSNSSGSGLGSGLRRQRPLLERLAAEWHQHYGDSHPFNWQHHRHHQSPPSPQQQQHQHPQQQQEQQWRQHRRRNLSHQHFHHRPRRLSESSASMQLSSEVGSMLSMGATPALSTALEFLSLDGSGDGDHRLLPSEVTSDMLEEEDEENKIEDHGETSELSSDSESEDEWPTSGQYPQSHEHHHQHHYLPGDGRTRWVDRRRFEMAMTEIDHLEHEQDEADEAFVGQNGLPSHHYQHQQYATEVATRGRQGLNTFHGPHHRRRYASTPPPSPLQPLTMSTITSTTEAMARTRLELFSEGDQSEYMTATSTMRADDSSLSTLCEGSEFEEDEEDEEEDDDDDCELPMPAYPNYRHHDYYHHQHPWPMSFMRHSSLMPLSRLEDDENNHGRRRDGHGASGPLVDINGGNFDRRDDQGDEGFRQQGRRSTAAPPPPLLSPSLAPSFTSTLVNQQQRRAEYYGSDLDTFSDREGDDEHEDGEDDEEEEEVVANMKTAKEKEEVAEQGEEKEEEVRHALGGVGEGHQHENLEGRGGTLVEAPSQMLRERATAMATYNYQLPNYQQQFRPRPIEDEPWWDPSPPELTLLQQQQHHHHRGRSPVRPTIGRHQYHHHRQHQNSHNHHRHHPSQSAAHTMMGWTLEPISARA
ncbi:hypothetical protein BGZ73_008647 [Actinomortierella ambigua]|nr:hypothetical protein BGZ73_008647 [Actinomortierella ambigua]